MLRDGALAAAAGSFICFCLGFLVGRSPQFAMMLMWGFAILFLVVAFGLFALASLRDSFAPGRRRS